MSASTWVITTFVFLGTTVLSLLLTASFWLFMKEEGRFFFMRAFDNRGIDVIRHEPLSNRLRLITVRWNGQFFQYGKEMILFGIEPLINPDTDAKKYYNDVLSRMCTWAGSRRPVLFATDIMSHMITPDLAALVAKSKKHPLYEKATKQILPKFMQLQDPDEPETVSYLETVKPDDLKDFMEDISARDAWQVYLKGKRVNELEKKQGMELGAGAKIAISLAGIGIVLIVIYLAATGQLQDIVQTMAH